MHWGHKGGTKTVGTFLPVLHTLLAFCRMRCTCSGACLWIEDRLKTGCLIINQAKMAKLANFIVGRGWGRHSLNFELSARVRQLLH